MNDTIEVIIEGLLAQKDKLEAVITELNSLEAEYSKDTKIINDRIDNLVLKDKEILDKFRQYLYDINKAITALQSVHIDLSPYATLDNLKEALDKIIIPTAINGVDGKDGRDGINGLDGLDGKDGINGKDGRDGVDGKDGIDGKSIKGDKGDRGLDGIGIDKLSFKDNTITITLTDGSKKDFKLPYLS